MATFENYINNVYNFRHRHSLPTEVYNLNIDNINIINLKVDISKDKVEVPCFFFTDILETLKDSSEYSHIVLPILCYNNPVKEYKSVNPLLKDFLSNFKLEAILKQGKGAGTIYYGGKGIICYEDLTPLLVLTIEVQKDENNSWIPTKQLCRLNRIIYERDDILAKHLRNKFLVNLVALKNHWIPRHYNSTASNIGNYYLSNNFEIIIDDLSSFIEKPIVANANSTSDAINDFLVNNKALLLSEMI